MGIDMQEVIAWAEGIVNLYGTECSPSEREYSLAQAIIDADEEWMYGG